MNKLVFLDTETTGNDLKEDRLCQICYKFEDEIDSNGKIFKKSEIVTRNFRPIVPISVKAMSVTNITNKMVEKEELFNGSKTAIELQVILNDNILVAHNAKFDIAMLESDGVKTFKNICTLRLARYLDDKCEIPEYSLQFLRYFYEMELNVVPHSAEGDVLVLEALFSHLYKSAKNKAGESVSKEMILDRMLDISEKPSLIRKFVFGKYNGKKIEDVAKIDSGYLEWLLSSKKKDEDEDWIYTLEYFLKK